MKFENKNYFRFRDKRKKKSDEVFITDENGNIEDLNGEQYFSEETIKIPFYRTTERTTSRPKKPIIYAVDKIDDVNLFKAVGFAIKMIRRGKPYGYANTIAAATYGYRTKDVAHYVGQRAQRLQQYRNDDSVVLYDVFRDIY